MKKLKTNALILIFLLSIFCFQGCDFLRRVAGRPTAEQLATSYGKKIAARKAAEDSLKVLEALADQRDRFLRDSLSGSDALKSLGIKTSKISRFGEPVAPVPYRYCLIIGVFRQEKTMNIALSRASKAGFTPFLIRFNDNVKAVALGGSDSLVELSLIAMRAIGSEACPRDSWVYCR